MAFTYIPIATVTVGASPVSTIDFTSIPATYTDLKIVVSARCNRTGFERDSIELTFNNNTSNYSTRTLNGSGSSAGSATGYSAASIQRADVNGPTTTSNTFSNIEFYIPNYAGSTYKPVTIDSVYEDNVTLAFIHCIAGLWSNTAAITSVKLGLETSSFVQYSTATLYGIKKD